jgi:hypothetical protein
MNFWFRFFQYFKTSCDNVGNGYLFDGEQVISTIGFRTITWVPYILCSPSFHVIPLWEGNIPNKIRINSSMVSEVIIAHVSTIVSHYFRQVNISLVAVSLIIMWLNFTIFYHSCSCLKLFPLLIYIVVFCVCYINWANQPNSGLYIWSLEICIQMVNSIFSVVCINIKTQLSSE